MDSKGDPRPALRGAMITSAGVGILALPLYGLGAAMLGGTQLAESYLFAYLFWMGLSLGCLSALMLHHLVAGRWGFMIQRIAEAGVSVLPLMAVLFIPIALSIDALYPWADPEYVAAHEVVAQKTPYLNTQAFLVRTAVVLVLFVGMGLLLLRWSTQLDRTGNPRFVLRKIRLSAVGLAVYVLAMTVAAIDWAMSLDPAWFSSIYPGLFIVGQGLTTLLFATLLLCWLARYEPFNQVLRVNVLHHLGNLILGFTVLWAYFQFSQYLIIWSGNLPEEVTWYLDRGTGPLNIIAVVLIVFHFALPFAVLLIRRGKRTIPALAALCVYFLALRLVDLFWIIVPSFTTQRLLQHAAVDLLAWLGIGGIWLAVFFYVLARRPMLSWNDDRMREIPGHDPLGTDITISSETELEIIERARRLQNG